MFNCNGCDIAPAPTIHLVVVAVRSFILRFLISLSWFERNFTRVVKWTKIFSQMTNIMLFTYSQQLLHVAHYSRQIRFCIKSICSNNNNTQVRRRREEKKRNKKQNMHAWRKSHDCHQHLYNQFVSEKGTNATESLCIVLLHFQRQFSLDFMILFTIPYIVCAFCVWQTHQTPSNISTSANVVWEYSYFNWIDNAENNEGW